MSSAALLLAPAAVLHQESTAFFAIHPLFLLPYVAPFCFQYINWRTELSSKLTETTTGLSKANNSLGVIGTQYWGKTANYSYSNANNWVNNVAKVTLPKGTYIFTITAKPQALGQNLDAFTLGVTGVPLWEAQSTSLIYFGSGFYPTCTHTFVASVNAGVYGVAIWSSHNRKVNDVEIMATRIK